MTIFTVQEHWPPPCLAAGQPPRELEWNPGNISVTSRLLLFTRCFAKENWRKDKLKLILNYHGEIAGVVGRYF